MEERNGARGEDADERDRLSGVVTRLGEEMPLRKGRNVGKVVWALGGELLAPHIDVERVKIFLGNNTRSTVRKTGTDSEGRRAGGCGTRR